SSIHLALARRVRQNGILHVWLRIWRIVHILHWKMTTAALAAATSHHYYLLLRNATNVAILTYGATWYVHMLL
ncbi:hypothetical protein IWW36_003703, partial [Coemansia brasiliensis]